MLNRVRIEDRVEDGVWGGDSWTTEREFLAVNPELEDVLEELPSGEPKVINMGAGGLFRVTRWRPELIREVDYTHPEKGISGRLELHRCGPRGAHSVLQVYVYMDGRRVRGVPAAAEEHWNFWTDAMVASGFVEAGA